MGNTKMDVVIMEQNLQWAIRKLRNSVIKREFIKIEISIQGGLVTGLTKHKTEKPGDE